MEELLIAIASVFVLGIGAQWLAHRFKLPSILLLLIFGFLAGPVTGLIDPAWLQGDWLFPVVALSVGVILFEGGLSLRLADLEEIGPAVRNLISVGVVVTWVLSALAAHFIAGFNLSVSIIIGSILVVTGPTVIVPLLRHIRPTGRIGTVAKWEGITIDPIGAILAVLVLESVLLIHEADGAAGSSLGAALGHALEGLFMEIVVGVGMAVLGTGLLILLLRRRLVPDYLQNPITLMVVIGAFAVSDVLKHESGLLTTTLMGIIMANQKLVPVQRIIAFKEDLRVLLIGTLFIMLSARLELSALAYFTDPRNLLFLLVLMLVVRPVAVLLSTLGTRLTWKEQAFLAWLAPRGIVAAAVAALFSFRLQTLYPAQAEALVPVIFLIIVGTVAGYGLTIGPVARWLGLAQPNPQGVLFIGAHTWVREMARVLHEAGFKVLLLDSNRHNVEQAHAADLPAKQANVLAEDVMETIDLSGIGRLLALTPNDEVNSLAALHFYEMFESAEVYQLSTRSEEHHEAELPGHLRGRPLFGLNTTFVSLSERFDRGAEVRAIELASDEAFGELQEAYDDRFVPLFLLRGKSDLLVFSEASLAHAPQADDTLVALLEAPEDVPASEERLETSSAARVES